MPARKSMSKRLRFSIFNRDAFTCQYCGRTPPDVMLQVDHIIAVSNGGTDDPENLRTSCVACNAGKATSQVPGSPVSEHDKLARLQDAMESQAVASDFAKAAKARDLMREEIATYICGLTGFDSCFKANVTIVALAVAEYGSENAISWLDTAARATSRSGSMPKESDMIRYFCGIMRQKRQDAVKS